MVLKRIFKIIITSYKMTSQWDRRTEKLTL